MSGIWKKLAVTGIGVHAIHGLQSISRLEGDKSAQESKSGQFRNVLGEIFLDMSVWFNRVAGNPNPAKYFKKPALKQPVENPKAFSRAAEYMEKLSKEMHMADYRDQMINIKELLARAQDALDHGALESINQQSALEINKISDILNREFDDNGVHHNPNAHKVWIEEVRIRWTQLAAGEPL